MTDLMTTCLPAPVPDALPQLVLTRLRVEQLRRFRAPYELSGLQPGLNLFTGPNESGKSTLVRAIRAAFFERHRSTSVDDLLPWGDSAAAPAVEIDFVLGGEPARLTKSFLQKKRCALQLGSQRLDGVEAEDRLAQIFGFAFAGKGASKSEHWGIPGLLWIEQGTGHEVLDPARHARVHLLDALQGLVRDPSEAAGGAAALGSTDGEALLGRFTRERAELLTPTGRPRGALADAQTQAERLAAEVAALDAQIVSYREQVDQLARERAEQAAELTEAPQRALQESLQRAQAEQQRLQQLGEQLARDRQQLAQLDGHRQIQAELLQRTQQQADEARLRTDACAQARLQHADAEAALQVAEAALQQAQAQHTAADAALQSLRQQERRQQLQQQLGAQVAARTRLDEALQRAEQAQTHLSALQQQADGCAITPAQMKSLRQLDQRVHDAQLQCEALATRLEIALEPGVTLPASDGTAWSGQGIRLVEAPLTLTLPGLGTLRIVPGGDDRPARQQALADARTKRQQALQALGLSDLAAAEARQLRFETLQTELRLAEQALRLGAPDGLDALRQAQQRAVRDVQQLEAALALLPPPADPSAVNTARTTDMTDTTGAVTVAPIDAATLARCEQAEQTARRALERARTEREQRRQAQATAQERLNAAMRELAAAEALLADPQRLARLQQLAQQIGQFDAERARLGGAVEAQAAQLQAARPDLVEQDIRRFTQSLAQQAQAMRERELRIARLESVLQQAGAQGLEEQRAMLAGEQLRATQRAAELGRRAAALEWLCRRLSQQRDAVLTRLQAPLQQHLQHYLQLLFPQARLTLDEQLVPTSLSRPAAGLAAGPPTGLPVGDSGEFESLSFGAREQLGLIVRLAYADLLRSAGRPTLLILDDALVHSDAARLAQMKRVLFDAAQRHQVLLFSCHPELWRDLGVAPRVLESQGRLESAR